MTESILIAIIGGVISLLVAIVPKIIDAKIGTKKKIEKLVEDVEQIKADQQEMGDIIYTMLDHMATNNNTGNMKRCLDAYNKYNRERRT